MTQIYATVLDALEPTWRDDLADEGAAGAAIAAVVLNSGQWKPSDIPEFSPDTLGTAYQRLLDNGYFQIDDDGQTVLLIDEGTEIDDGMWWVLLMTVAKGYLERVPGASGTNHGGPTHG